MSRMETRWDLVLELFREPFEKDQICQFQKCSPCWEEQSINRVFHSSISRSRVIVADITKGCRGMETRWELVLELFREPLEINLICQFQKCSPRWEEQSINRVFHSGIHGSRVIVADITKGCRGMETRWDLVIELFWVSLEIDQICNCKDVRLVERNNLLIEYFTLAFLDLELLLLIQKKMSRNWNPLGACTWIISRTIRDRSNISIAKMFALLRGTIY